MVHSSNPRPSSTTYSVSVVLTVADSVLVFVIVSKAFTVSVIVWVVVSNTSVVVWMVIVGCVTL